jgi:hypothetical protein
LGLSLEESAVVIARFPYSSLTRSSIRPTLVLADAGLGDWILGQITTNAEIDSLAIELTNDSLAQGSLHTISYFRPNKLFTGNESLITRTVATLKPEVFNRLLDATMDVLNQNRMR